MLSNFPVKINLIKRNAHVSKTQNLQNKGKMPDAENN